MRLREGLSRHAPEAAAAVPLESAVFTAQVACELHIELVGAEEQAQVVRREMNMPARDPDGNIDLPALSLPWCRGRRAGLPATPMLPGSRRSIAAATAPRRPPCRCCPHVGGKRGRVGAMRGR